jgi:hypothetical protein
LIKMETRAFICQHVFDDVRPVMLVCRSDGDWQLVCGSSHEEGEGPRLVGLNHLLDRDPTLNEIVDLPDEWEAERSEVGGAWTRRPLTEALG